MRIFGLDFTSAPRRRKPITCAACTLRGEVLYFEALTRLEDFDAFEGFLRSPGPWMAGLDFPFGQPGKLVAGLGWPRSWAGYVGVVAGMDMAAFEAALAAYREGRPPGDRQHLRATDALADSRSPMMLYGVPVGRMFFRGAPRLLRAGVCVLPCRPTDADRIVVEAYPALVARRFVGRRSYKSDIRRRQTAAQEAARRAIVDGLRSEAMGAVYGFAIRLSDGQAEGLVGDPTGDSLDALLCAAQAAWAYTQRERGYGIPGDCDADEGWIVDPALLA